MKIARWPTSQTASLERDCGKENGYAPNARKRGVEVNDASGRHCDAYILLFNFSRQGVMRHEKSLGRYCRWISRREHAPGAPRPTAGSRWRTPPASASPRASRRAVVLAGRPPRAVTLLFVMNGFTRPQIIAMFIFRTAALLVIQFNGGGI